MARICADDLLALHIGDLRRAPRYAYGAKRPTIISPGEYRKGVAFARSGEAVAYELNTYADPPFIVLSYERARTTFPLERDTVGRWYFVGTDGLRSLKAFYFPPSPVGGPNGEFVTRSSAGLPSRASYLSRRKRIEQTRARVAEKLRALYARRPYFEREARLEARLAELTRALERR